MLTTKEKYVIPDIILSATDAVLLNDVFLVVLYATRIPPHLSLAVNGKLFSLSVAGATVDGELNALLKLIRRNQIATLFIKLEVPALFTLADLSREIKKYTLAYPRVDIGIATCLSPIKDFCSEIYDTDIKKVNFVYELLPKLYEQKVISCCYQLNLKSYTFENSFAMNKYSMNDIFEGIRSSVTSVL